MNTSGSITLGELVRKLDMLDVACHRCDRRGRLSLERLIASRAPRSGVYRAADQTRLDAPGSRQTREAAWGLG